MRPYILFLALMVSTASAQVPVIPGGLANTEGNSSTTNALGLGYHLFQQVYSASEFGFFGSATGRIDRIYFRLDSAAGTNLLAGYSMVIYLATTSHFPDGLSPDFDNAGADQTIVYQVPLIPFTATYLPGVEPQPFSLWFQLSTPFYYVPSRGNLLLTISSGGMFNPVPLDAQSVLGDSISSVFWRDSSSSGVLDTGGLATRFDITLVPEPSPWPLLGIGGSLLVAVFKRWPNKALLRRPRLRVGWHFRHRGRGLAELHRWA